jgi:hypothetical protein
MTGVGGQRPRHFRRFLGGSGVVLDHKRGRETGDPEAYHGPPLPVCFVLSGLLVVLAARSESSQGTEGKNSKREE